MWIVILTATTLICAVKWIKWKIITLAIIYYMEKSQYKQPDSEDIAECTDFVVKNAVKDLIGR